MEDCRYWRNIWTNCSKFPNVNNAVIRIDQWGIIWYIKRVFHYILSPNAAVHIWHMEGPYVTYGGPYVGFRGCMSNMEGYRAGGIHIRSLNSTYGPSICQIWSAAFGAQMWWNTLLAKTYVHLSLHGSELCYPPFKSARVIEVNYLGLGGKFPSKH